MAVTKLTVLYGKRAVKLELPPTATLTDLAEAAAQRLDVAADPHALKFKVPGAEESLRVREYPHATLESAGIPSGSKVRMSISKRHAAATADGGDAGAAAGQPAAAAAAAPAEEEAPQPQFSKGQAVLYRTREGDWQEAKVVDVDYSIIPPSFGIEIDGHYRETEATRLKPLPA